MVAAAGLVEVVVEEGLVDLEVVDLEDPVDPTTPGDSDI